MSLICRVAQITNERHGTVRKYWHPVRVHEAEIVWYQSKGYDCVKLGSQSGTLETTI